VEMGDCSGRMAARCSAGSTEALLADGAVFVGATHFAVELGWIEGVCAGGGGYRLAIICCQIETYVPLISPYYVSDTG
jgi:hypothetical protein